MIVKKLVSLMMLVVLAGLTAGDVFAATQTVEGVTYTYSISDGKATIGTGDSNAISTSTSGAIVIPSTLGGCPVTTIGSCAFLGCSSLTSVTIPSSVTTIGSLAFFSCSSLTSVTIPEGVTTIGASAFSECESLQGIEVDAANTSYCSIGGVLYTKDVRTLVACPGAKTSVTIPESVMTIGEHAFFYCRSLTAVTIQEGVTTIGSYAFCHSSSLTSVTIPSTVTTIGECAFLGCESLQGIEVDSTNMSYCSIDGILYTKDVRTLIRCAGAKTSVVIPEGRGVVMIGIGAFESCHSLTSVSIPLGVTTIGGGAFVGCRSLTSVTISDSVTEIGNAAFDGCTSLTSVTIPSSVTTIRNNPFTWTVKLNSFIVSPENSSYRAIDGVLYTKDGQVLVACPGARTSVTIPASVTTIGESAFSWCLLTSVTIPSGVTTIGSCAFLGCSLLTSVTIPESVTTIGEWAFSGCSSLKSVYVDYGDTARVKDLMRGKGVGVDQLTFIEQLPDGGPYTETVNGVTWTYSISDGKATIGTGDSAAIPQESSGTLVIPSKLGGCPVTTIGAYAFSNCNSLTSVTIPSSVTTIEKSAFYRCRSLTSVTIPSSVTTIMEYAFFNCSSLTSVTIPSSVTTIGNSAFSNCRSLTSITIPTSVTTIGEFAFSDCSSLTSVMIPSGVTSIGNYVFSGCSSLTSVTIPDSVTMIGSDAFYGCRSLTSITIPSSVTTIGEVAFYGCSSLTSVMIPSSVTTIGESAFGGCSSLTSVTIPEGVTTIGNRAFNGCSSLKSVTIPESLKNVGELLFAGTPWYEVGLLKVLSNAGTGSGTADSVTVKQEVVHYVVNSVQPSFVIPATYDTGFVNVIAEVKGGCVAIPATWTVNYPKFTEKFGSDFTKALSMKSGKIAAGGREMLVWEDYVAGTDPTDPNDKFTASMTLVDGKPVISWTPELDADRAALRKYTTYGKEKLTDSEWTVVPEGRASDYNFFKVTVEMK